MSKSAYVITKHFRSPIAIGYTAAHEVLLNRKDAISRCVELNKKATRAIYNVVRVPLVSPEAK